MMMTERHYVMYVSHTAFLNIPVLEHFYYTVISHTIFFGNKTAVYNPILHFTCGGAVDISKRLTERF